jgi:hypothetical protein
MSNRYQMGNQKPSFKGQTKPWPTYIKEVIRSRNSKDRQSNSMVKRKRTRPSTKQIELKTNDAQKSWREKEEKKSARRQKGRDIKGQNEQH